MNSLIAFSKENDLKAHEIKWIIEEDYWRD